MVSFSRPAESLLANFAPVESFIFGSLCSLSLDISRHLAWAILRSDAKLRVGEKMNYVFTPAAHRA
jgi:hypothetical protein